MKREEKYPDTRSFHFYNANPKGRTGGDCVVRALCTAMNQPWDVTVRELTELGIELGYVLNDKHTYEKYLTRKGWTKHKQPKKSDNTKYTGKEFTRIIDKKVNYIARIGGHHIVAIMNGRVNDIWNSTDGCIGNYWTKTEEN